MNIQEFMHELVSKRVKSDFDWIPKTTNWIAGTHKFGDPTHNNWILLKESQQQSMALAV